MSANVTHHPPTHYNGSNSPRTRYLFYWCGARVGDHFVKDRAVGQNEPQTEDVDSVTCHLCLRLMAEKALAKLRPRP